MGYGYRAGSGMYACTLYLIDKSGRAYNYIALQFCDNYNNMHSHNVNCVYTLHMYMYMYMHAAWSAPVPTR